MTVLFSVLVTLATEVLVSSAAGNTVVVGISVVVSMVVFAVVVPSEKKYQYTKKPEINRLLQQNFRLFEIVAAVGNTVQFRAHGANPVLTLYVASLSNV